MSSRISASLLVLTLVLLNPAGGNGEPVDDCGRIEAWDSCVFFSSISNGHDWFFLDNYGNFQRGEFVHVSGEPSEGDSTCGNLRLLVLRDNAIEACPAENLGCGVLSGPTYDNDCYFWCSPIYGEILCDARDHTTGDTLHAWGNVDRSCLSFCLVGQGAGCLVQQRFSACADTLTPVAPRTWGRIKWIYR